MRINMERKYILRRQLLAKIVFALCLLGVCMLEDPRDHGPIQYSAK